MANLEIVDLFCGCGGFSLGAHLAGFKTVLAVDVDPLLSSAFRKNFPKTELLNADLSRVDLRPALEEKNVVGVIGGPPCQGFSLIGRRARNDPRNKLVSHFFRHIAEIKPAFFVMENVPGILAGDAYATLKKGIRLLQGRYKIVGPIKVNAADFGAATLRTRILLIGFDETRMTALSPETFKVHKSKRSNVRDAIADLPSPIDIREDASDYDWTDYRVGKSKYALKASKLPPKGLGYAPALENLKKRKISGLLPTTHTPSVSKRFYALQAGAMDSVSRASRLEWTKQCSTLRAGTGSDKGSYQSVRPIHPTEHRVITVREAARLQGFPDWFVFHPTKWHSFRMIGNSVSPYLSEGVMSLIAESLRNRTPPISQVNTTSR